MLSGQRAVADHRILAHAHEATGLAHAYAFGDVIEDRQGLLIREARLEQGSALSLGETLLAGSAVEQSDTVPLAKAHADGQVPGPALAEVGADLVLTADKTGAIILGGGISKHHIIGANILREGLDCAVYISTAAEFDGSLSGAQTREAKSWGKLKERGNSVQVNCDATIALPLIASALKEKGVL